MALKAVRPDVIFKGGDPNFNYKAAQEAFNLVMKMDIEEARAFTELVVGDAMEEIIEKNLRMLQSHLDKVVSKRMDAVRKATLRAVTKRQDDGSALAFAQALTEISKAGEDLVGADLARFNQAHPRGGGGRFRTKVTHSQQKPIHEKTAAALGIPKAPEGLDRKQEAEFQDEYRQLANFLGAVHNSSANPGDSDVFLHFQDKNTGQSYFTRKADTKPDASDLDPANARLVGIEARPNTLNAGGAAFGLTTALGGSTNDAVARRTAMINNVDTGIGTFADTWNKEIPNAERNNTAGVFNRLEAGSAFLGGVAPAGSKVQLAAAFGEFVGRNGPQAEAVIGPHARKTAYRYRGTERAPDASIVRLYDRAIQQSKQQSRYDKGDGDDRPGRYKTTPKPAPGRGISQMGRDRAEDGGRPPTWDERDAGRRVIVDQLRARMPERGLYGLHLAAGHVPPSEGIMLNSEGQIVSQAIGYADDHYLPFNLKNLKDLKGGEYIRTRSVGGPTSEDIYTGLVSGARQVTVVSRSGTFTITFNDDFRGGRRHNDKARRMTRRYEQILDAVQSEQVERKDIPPRWKKRIEEEVREELPGANKAMIREEVRDRIAEFKENPEIDEQDEARAEAIVRDMETAGAQGRATKAEVAAFRSSVYNELAEMKEVRFRLNGMGYEAALNTLREQFPYYISVKSVPTKELERIEPEKDKGYVEPGRNRPTEANAGWYGTAGRLKGMGNAGTGQISASSTNYQRGRYGNAGTKAGTEVQGNLTPMEQKKKDKEAFKEKFAENNRQLKARRSAAELRNAIVAATPAERAPKPPPVWWTWSDEEAENNFKDSQRLKEFHSWTKTQRVALTTQMGDDIKSKTRAFEMAAGDHGGVEYKKTLGQIWPESPYKFTDRPAYKDGATKDVVRAEMKRLDGKSHGVTQDKALSQMSDSELRNEVDIVSSIKRQMEETPEVPAHMVISAIASEVANTESAWLKSLVGSPAKMDEHLEAVHRQRFLRKQAEKAPEAPAQTERATATVEPGQPAEYKQTGKPPTAEGKENLVRLQQLRRQAENLMGELPGTDPMWKKLGALTADVARLEEENEEQNRVITADDVKSFLDTHPEASRAVGARLREIAEKNQHRGNGGILKRLDADAS